ncbi:MAG: hypothetical protein WKF58_02395 [Ilumatobacteraceae bacterium]
MPPSTTAAPTATTTVPPTTAARHHHGGGHHHGAATDDGCATDHDHGAAGDGRRRHGRHHRDDNRRLAVPQTRRILLAVCLVALAGCRLDAEVAVEMQSDGTGTVTVTATADAELVDEVPDLAGQLDLSDARDAGWRAGEITETDGRRRATDACPRLRFCQGGNRARSQPRRSAVGRHDPPCRRR